MIVLVVEMALIVVFSIVGLYLTRDLLVGWGAQKRNNDKEAEIREDLRQLGLGVDGIRVLLGREAIATYLVIKEASQSAKVVSGNLHKGLFRLEDVLSAFKETPARVDLLFGPKVCLAGAKVLRVAKERENIHLYLLRDQPAEDHFTIVDGKTVYLETSHAELDEPAGAFEIENERLAKRMERLFEDLVKKSIEIDKTRLVDSIGEERIITAGGRVATKSEIQHMRSVFGESEGGEDNFRMDNSTK